MVHECFVLRKTEDLFYIFKIYWFYTWIIKKKFPACFANICLAQAFKKTVFAKTYIHTQV